MKRFFKSMMVAVAAITAVMTLSSFAYQDDELDAKAILKGAVEEMHKTKTIKQSKNNNLRGIWTKKKEICGSITIIMMSLVLMRI